MNQSAPPPASKSLPLRQSWFLGVTAAAVILMFAFVIVPHLDPKPLPLSGQKAADFNLELIDGDAAGDRIQLSDLRGQTVILDFWASWCKPCREQSAILKDLASDLGPDVTILGVATSDQRASAESFVKAAKPPYSSAYDEGGEVATAYRVTTLPTLIIVDPQGVVRTWESRIFAKEELLALTRSSGE